MKKDCAVKKIRQLCKTLLPWAALLVLLWAMAVPRGWIDSADVSYNITNGDFQNYNPVRRLLDGQAPYADFAVYLGAGELYSVGAVLLCIGNTFANSVFAAGALTWFFYELLVLAVGVVVLGRGRQARVFALVVSAWNFLALIGQPVPFAQTINRFLGISGYVGNSARMIRFSALTLLVLVVSAGLHLWQARGARPLFGSAQTLPQRLRAALRWPLHPAVLVPLAAGALVPWSNDAGGAAYIAVALGYGLFLIRQYKKDVLSILRGTLGYIAVSVVGLGLSVTVVSWGHPLAWLRQTRGVSSMQTWYYGSDPATKLCYLTDFQPSGWFFPALALAAAFAAVVLLAKSHRTALQAAGCLALTLGAALWELLYAVGSGVRGGTDAGGQMLLGLLIPAGLALALRTAARRLRRARPPRHPLRLARCTEAAALLLACGAAVVGIRTQQADTAQVRQDLTYQPELGGWMGDQAEKLDRERTVLDGAAVFGTYAGGVETLTGQFQPTGVDYIIHAMGDRQRLNYLLAFQNGDFTYAETPSPKVASYERWARNANWWFYRDLYRFWEPAGSTSYCGGMHLIWQRTADGDLQQPTTVTLEQTAPNRVTLTVTADDPAFDGVADVTLDYAVSLDGHPLHSYLYVNCVTEERLWAERGKDGSANYFLPTDRTTAQIPVTIAGGVGVVELEVWPTDAASLTVSAATVNATTVDWEYFFE